MKGEDHLKTAMSKLVGLPMGIFVRLVMDGKINSKGVNIPVMPEVYNPVLAELKKYGVEFVEEEKVIAD
jgi:saccharopine dehydrogenase (NADP+, L-glutamate forming)